MSTRQYIGARYTPKFSGTYDATQAYEALEVVDNGSGTTYIARKPVPPNTPLTNTEYWLVYGSSSGAILDLQTRVNTIENTDIPAINNSITSINGSIANITDVSIPAIQGEINTINAKIAAIKNKKFLFIGDSYADEAGEWLDKVVANLGLSSSDYYSLCTGGHGFTGKDGAPGGVTGENLRWITDLTNFVGAHTQAQLEEITDVYIIGGFNDIYSGVSVIENYIASFMTYAQANLPNAKFYIGLAAWAGIADTITTPNTTYTGDAARFRIVSNVLPAYSVCGKYGAAYIGNLFLALHNYNADFDSTYYHPSDAGATKLAAAICSYIIGGSFTIRVPETATIIANGGTQITMFTASQVDNNIEFTTIVSPNDFTVTFDAAVGAAGGIELPWTVVSGLVAGRGTGAGNMTFRCDLWTGSKLIPAYMYISNHKICLILTEGVTAGTYRIRMKRDILMATDC